MTLIIYDEALRRLMDVPPPNVAAAMQEAGDAIAREAQHNVRKILWQAGSHPIVVAEMTRDQEGPVVKVHLDGYGRQSAYLDAKEDREHSWLLPALEAVRL